MERWTGRVALVTGASAGIGASICSRLVKQGMTVIGCARNAERIEELAKDEEIKSSPGKLHSMKCDMSKEGEILAMFAEIREKFGRIDVCINNAGFSANCPLLSGETDDWMNMLKVNVLAVCICTREAVKLMREKEIEEGQIIHIGSTFGHRVPDVSFPGFNFYCGTKFMIRALTEGLRQELNAGNTDNCYIRVASVSPGKVETEFLYRCLNRDMASAWYAASPNLYPNDVADAVLYILQAPPKVNVSDVIMLPVDKGK